VNLARHVRPLGRISLATVKCDPGFTPRTHTHLMPGSEKRTREAVNRAFEDGPKSDDGPTTAQGA
jgi:hypothetical protein